MARLVEIWALRNPTLVNASSYKMTGRTIDEKKISVAIGLYGKENKAM